MRLKLNERQSLVRVNASRYQGSSKRQKRRILEEFVESTGYNRCYASLLLSRHGRRVRVDTKTTLVGEVSKPCARSASRSTDRMCWRRSERLGELGFLVR